jgi:hypothetical protein
LFGGASAAEQSALLSLAARQGVVYAHQLPTPTNGTRIPLARPLLPQILAGHLDALEPLRAETVEIGDPELDLIQREAVARALQTPDICLIQGLPGTGKSRVVAEILTRAAARGERVLFLAPSAAALDRVLEMIAGRPEIFAVRCLEREETSASLPPCVRDLTFEEQARRLTAQTMEGARRQGTEAEQSLARIGQEERVWTDLDELARRRERLDEQCHELATRRERLPVEVNEEATQFQNAVAGSVGAAVAELARARDEAFADLDHRLADLRQQQEGRCKELATLAEQMDLLRLPVEAKREGRWWTKAWWQATVHGYNAGRWEELDNQRQQAQSCFDALESESASLSRERDQAAQRFETEREHLLHAEVNRRLGALDAQDKALQEQLADLERVGHHLSARLAPDSTAPVEMTTEAVRKARALWTGRLEQARGRVTLARQWMSYLEQEKTKLAARLQDYINLVAGLTTSLAADPYFGDRATSGTGGPITFDLLVLEEADQSTESEFLNVARRAGRWVLVGEPAWEDGKDGDSDKTGTPRRSVTTAGVLPLGRATVFHRLWQVLHCDPRRLPYTWFQENGRLACRLRPVAPEQRHGLETEQVADFPDIELRILTVPRGQPELAEIVFPPSMPLDRAKQYIFQELQELAVRPSHHSLRWVEEPDRLVLRLSAAQLPHDQAVTLEPGVCETLGPVTPSANGAPAAVVGWQTCCLEFDRSAGWHRHRAEEWIRHHLGLRDLGRTVRLDTVRRMDPNLADFVWSLLGHGAERPATGPLVAAMSSGRSAVEFIPVPPLATTRDSKGREPARGGRVASSPQLSRKGGAGLELDLNDPRQRERLPPEYRNEAFSRGIVNYPEAQAIVGALTELVGPANILVLDGATVRPTIAVLALYAGQADLIRRMIQQVPSLAALDLVVDVPTALRQREAEIVLVSLTRSHTHRAVAYGETSQSLVLALTRARSKLLLFGDPGTLARRSQWEGPLEQLDDAAAARERNLITHLVHYLEGHGPYPRAFHLRQGIGS